MARMDEKDIICRTSLKPPLFLDRIWSLCLTQEAETYCTRRIILFERPLTHLYSSIKFEAFASLKKTTHGFDGRGGLNFSNVP